MKNVLLMLGFLHNMKCPIKNTMHHSPITNFIYKTVQNDES